MKNLNSFRFLRMALDYEIARQVAILEDGGRIEQETRLYDAESGITVGMRSKEHAHDYRYFPEPDLLPLIVSDEWRERLRSEMPELPGEKRARFIDAYGLREYDADVLTQTRELAAYFEKVAVASGNALEASKWVQGDLMALLNAQGKDITESPVAPDQLGDLLALIGKGELSGKMAKEVFAKMFATELPGADIIEREGMRQISDTSEIAKIIDDVLARNPKQLEQYRSGKTSVAAFFVGQVMKATRGQANPQAVNELLKQKLDSR